MILCGCGEKEAKYLVYEDMQPHCVDCYDDAISTNIQVLVRKIEGGESLESIGRSYRVPGEVARVPKTPDQLR